MNVDRLWLAGCALTVTVLATAVFAQSSGGGCEAEALQDPPRTVLTCLNGVRIVERYSQGWSVCRSSLPQNSSP